MAWLKGTVNKKPVLINTDGIVLFTAKGNKIVVLLATGMTLEIETNWTLEAIEPILGEIVDMTSPPSPLFTPLEFQTNLPDLSDLFGKEAEESGEQE
jgi:hypothetical protein